MGKIGKFLLLAMLGTQTLIAGGSQELWNTFRTTVLRQAKSPPDLFLRPQIKGAYKLPCPYGIWTVEDADREEVAIVTMDSQGIFSEIKVSFLGYYPAVTTTWRLLEGTKDSRHPLTPVQLQALSRFSQHVLETMIHKEKEMGGRGPFWREEMSHLGLWGSENLEKFSQGHWKIFGLKNAHLPALLRLNDRSIRDHFEKLNRPVPAIYHEFGYKPPVE